MKTAITISGQTAGNFTLKNALNSPVAELRVLPNGYKLIFSTKKEARRLCGKLSSIYAIHWMSRA
jgi:hypothetical protein